MGNRKEYEAPEVIAMRYLPLIVALVLLAGCATPPTIHFYYIPSADVYLVSKPLFYDQRIYFVSDYVISEDKLDQNATHLTVFTRDSVMLFFPQKEQKERPFYFYANKGECSFLNPRYSYVIFPRSCDSLMNNSRFVPLRIPIETNPGQEWVSELSRDEYYHLLEKGGQSSSEIAVCTKLPKPLSNRETIAEKDSFPINLYDRGFQFGKTRIECVLYDDTDYPGFEFYFYARLPSFVFIDPGNSFLYRRLEAEKMGDYSIEGTPLTVVRTDMARSASNYGDDENWTAIEVTKYAGKYRSEVKYPKKERH